MRALALLLVLGPLAAQDTAPAVAPARMDASLADFDGRVDVFVRMADQLVPTGRAFETFVTERATTPRSTVRRASLAGLHERADRDWERLAPTIAALKESGGIRDVQRFWIVNGFACEADAAAVAKLAALDAVGYVHRQTQPGAPLQRTRPRPPAWLADRKADEKAALARRATLPAETAFDAEGLVVPWNLSRVHADRAWQLGADGSGVVVAVLDTGVLPIPAIIDALWQNPGETLDGKDNDGNGFVDDLFGWDFQGETRFVVGDGDKSHGTMCSGIIAGRPNGEPKTITGVAPRARLCVMRGMGSLRAYEYAATVGADVLSMSYMWTDVELGSFRGVFRTAHEHLAACGIVAVGGAGNFGRTAPEGRQIALPKDIPCVIAAAGVFEDGEAPPFSSRGPCMWDDVPFFEDFPADHPLMKPDVTACNGGFPIWHWTAGARNEVVWKDTDGTGLIIGPRGNSFAGPHAAGVAALMLSANRELTPWRVKALMEATCSELGAPGRDTTYGAGLLQADRAVEAAKSAKVE